MNVSLASKFQGSMLGGMIGDVIGAVVEAESSGYIRKTFRDVDAILSTKEVTEVFGDSWQVGRFTDDTQMSLCVAEWLIQDNGTDGRLLLRRFVKAYEPWRRYGSGTRLILENFTSHEDSWRQLATAMFPQGSYGNGSAMRAAPIGLCFHQDLNKLIEIARTSSVTTHSHPFAIQGAVLQATAVALATRTPTQTDPEQFLRLSEAVLTRFQDDGQDVSKYQDALKVMNQGVASKASPSEISKSIGTGIEAYSAVPMALYCFLAHMDSLENTISEAVFLGGDTDTIASMAGSISGAYLGDRAIPKRWLQAVREDRNAPDAIAKIAVDLHSKSSNLAKV